jgi:murein L,D-transpeptidase YcbB/YkuD
MTINQIRERLFLSGELKSNSGSHAYDTELMTAIKKYQIHNGMSPDLVITNKLIAKMNVSVGERIKQIVVNMERCRWVSPEVVKSPELIFVNIPSYKLRFYRKEVLDFESDVVVGRSMSKTVIFSEDLRYIVFSPYWNVPKSIIEKEVKPGMAKDPNYLVKHQMEWNNGQVRQLPGKKNSLGLIKFMFPNSNDIYMHDTPSKSLFEKDNRAFSHGCIRVAKPKELAQTILREDANWTAEKIDQAMNSGQEKWYTIKNKIPVYIGYFTALADDRDEVYFFDDIYKRDERLAKIIMN